MTRRQLMRLGASAAVTAASLAPALATSGVVSGDWTVNVAYWQPGHGPWPPVPGTIPLSPEAHRWLRLGSTGYAAAAARLKRELAEMRANDWDADE